MTPQPESSSGSPSKASPGEPVGSKDWPSVDDSVTEETPLLRSESSSPAAGSVSSATSELSQDEDSPDLDTPNQRVSRARGLAIVLSVYLLIFLQGRLDFKPLFASNHLSGTNAVNKQQPTCRVLPWRSQR